MGWQIFFFLQSYEFSLSRYESLSFINKKQIADILIVAKILFSVTANIRVCWLLKKYDILRLFNLQIEKREKIYRSDITKLNVTILSKTQNGITVNR